MRIGIITYHSVYNFGANLQAYSTIGYLNNNGYDPLIINWIPKDLEEGYKKGNPHVQAEAHIQFIETHLPLTELCRSTEDVVNSIKNYNIDAILIGSDAVLQHKTFLSRIRISKRGITLKPKRSNVIFPNPFWGSFIPFLEKSIPISLMSASSQNMNYKIIKGLMKRKIGAALLKFSTITVRDEWTKEMINYFTKGKINPKITPDPVFAYNQNITNQISREEILKRFNLPEKYILFSFKNKGKVSDIWIKECLSIIEHRGISGVILTMPGGVIFNNPICKTLNPPLSPTEWYALIKYSSGYIGENMHPIVVSLHNSVPFYAFDDYGITKLKYFINEKSSKIYSILTLAGFLDNRVGTLGKGYKCPSPQKVMNSIFSFDFKKCTQFSSMQLIRYNEMMKSILNS